MVRFTTNDVFLVTGSSSGIGWAIAREINEFGGRVIAVARNRAKLEELKKVSKNSDQIVIEVRDLSIDVDGLSQWVLDLSSKYGKFKGLVLAAGAQQVLPLRALTTAKVKDLFDLNLFSSLALCKGFCDKRTNRGKGSSIVFISSIASITGNAGIIAYSATKGAINAAVRSMAVEMAKDGIRVNAVLPGMVRSEIIDKWRDVYTDEYLAKLQSEYPLGLGEPDDVAHLVAFLLSDDARWITGSEFVIDGGASL